MMEARRLPAREMRSSSNESSSPQFSLSCSFDQSSSSFCVVKSHASRLKKILRDGSSSCGFGCDDDSSSSKDAMLGTGLRFSPPRPRVARTVQRFVSP